MWDEHWFITIGRRERRHGRQSQSRFHGSVGLGWAVVERYIQNQEKPNARKHCTGSVLKSGIGWLRNGRFMLV